MDKKRLFRVKVLLELKDVDGLVIMREYRKRFTAVDIEALRQRLKIFRAALRKDLEKEFPGGVVHKMDFFLSDGKKVLGKGAQKERRERKDRAHRETREADRRIASGQFEIE